MIINHRNFFVLPIFRFIGFCSKTQVIQENRMPPWLCMLCLFNVFSYWTQSDTSQTVMFMLLLRICSFQNFVWITLSAGELYKLERPRVLCVIRFGRSALVRQWSVLRARTASHVHSTSGEHLRRGVHAGMRRSARCFVLERRPHRSHRARARASAVGSLESSALLLLNANANFQLTLIRIGCTLVWRARSWVARAELLRAPARSVHSVHVPRRPVLRAGHQSLRTGLLFQLRRRRCARVGTSARDHLPSASPPDFCLSWFTIPPAPPRHCYKSLQHTIQ